jgi:hypothetical protein
MGRVFPREWEAFAAAVPAAERGGDLSAAYMTPVGEGSFTSELITVLNSFRMYRTNTRCKVLGQDFSGWAGMFAGTC